MLFFGDICAYANKIKNFKCPICGLKVGSELLLIAHVMKAHADEIPEGVTARQHIFNLRRGKDHQVCCICKVNNTEWNEQTGRYRLICENPSCKAKAREKFLKNYKKKHGKDHTLNDPEQQQKMMYAKKNAGEYKFKDGGTIKYMSSYELDFLKVLDEDLGLPSDIDTIRECDVYFKYTYEGKEHIYIPDYYLKVYNLIVEIKSQDSTHPKLMAIDRETEKLKDAAVKKDGSYNYIKIVEKNYAQFLELIQILRNEHFNTTNYDRYIIIPKVKPPKNYDKLPEINFIKDASILFKNKYVQDIFNTTADGMDCHRGMIAISLILNKKYIPTIYITKEDEALFIHDKIFLRAELVDPKNIQDVKQKFLEFDKYITKKYAKFINQDYLSVMISVTQLFPIWLINMNDKEAKKLLQIIVTTQKISEEFITMSVHGGFIVLIKTNKQTWLTQRKSYLSFIKDINKTYNTNILTYDPYNEDENVQVGLDYIPIPFTLDGGVKVEIIEEYSNLKL